MRVSACLIVKNEEKVISRCINSFKNIVDEIVIVDTGSIDKTVNIAEEFGCRVFDFEWVNDFSAARNFAISKATGDWIIFLDADEYFKDQSITHSLQKIIKKIHANPNIDGVFSTIINIDADSENFQDSFSAIRIFRRKKNIYYTKTIHEELGKENGTLQLYDGTKDIIIFHTGYSSSDVQSKNKMERNEKLLLTQLLQDPNNPQVHYYLSDCYILQRNFDKALHHINKALEQKKINQTLLAHLYRNKVNAYKLQNRPPDELINIVHEALTFFPTHAEFHMVLGEILLIKNQSKDAIEAFQNALKFAAEGHFLTSVVAKEAWVEGWIGFAYEKLRNNEKAVAHYVKSLKNNKHIKMFLTKLIVLLTKHESEMSIINFLSQIYDTGELKDIDVIIESTINARAGRLCAYYYSLRVKLTDDHNHFIAYVSFLNKKYKTASKLFLERAKNNLNEENLLLCTTSAILDHDLALLNELKDLDHEKKYAPFLEAIISNDISAAIAANKNLFKSFVEQLLYLGEFAHIDSLILPVKATENHIFILDEVASWYTNQSEFLKAKNIYSDIKQLTNQLTGPQSKNNGICLKIMGETIEAESQLLWAIKEMPNDYECYYHYLTLDRNVDKKILLKAKELFPYSNWIKNQSLVDIGAKS